MNLGMAEMPEDMKKKEEVPRWKKGKKPKGKMQININGLI